MHYSFNSERCMRPSESSVENDSIVFTYAQRFSKMPDDEGVATKRVNPKRPIPVVGLSLEKNHSEEQNKDVNSSDTENASPAITFGPKDINSVCDVSLSNFHINKIKNKSPFIHSDFHQYVDESYDIPRSHQLPYTKQKGNNNGDHSMELGASCTSASMLELAGSRSSRMSSTSAEFTSSTMPKKRSHFYTNAAPAKVEGNVFRYDFDDKVIL